ncbi:MAG: pantoate--beta-alanine ligase [Opitutales bacterium]|jgi:pantoate--beta-alanine ligase
MQIIQTIPEMQSLAIALRTQGKLIGLVPTMGALHEGHLKLIDAAKEKADVVIVSIFVNPAQFGPSEDFTKYPRTFEADVAACEGRGADIIFAPKKEMIYPPGYSTYVTEERLSKGLCGISRPGHFRGVCTVVNILFNITRPDLAVFGRKDAQQAAIIQKMVTDLVLPVEVLVVPTVREADGMAMSSRNRYLSEEQRVEARKINQALREGKRMVEEGVRSVDRVLAEVTHILSLSRRLRVIYVALVDRETMAPVREIEPGKGLLAVAVWLNEVRLIDNVEV